MKKFSMLALFILPMLIPSVTQANTISKEKMIEGILALRGKYGYINRNYAERLVNEVVEVTSMPGNTWMKPHDLLGLAINESDLRGWIETGPKYAADCGITQNHVPLFAKTYRERRILCERLKRSTKLSFIYALKELNHIRNKYCFRFIVEPTRKNSESTVHFNRRLFAWKENGYRCLYNTYNQGPIFLWKSCEQRVDKNKYTGKYYWSRVLKCRWRNRYWLRSMCFSTGVKLSKKPSLSCRKASSVWWIKRVYR